jgi:outer membrane protein assembly factor BamA
MKCIGALLLALCCLSAAQAQERDIELNIVLTGADSVPADVRNAIASEIRRTVTEPGQIPDEMMERIRDQFQERGYFKAMVEAPKTTETRNSSGYVTSMEVRVHIDEGQLYRLGRITFTGEKVFDPGRLRSAVPMQDGEIFKVVGMRQGLKNLHDLYCARGYINFTPVPNTDIDEEHLLINITLDIDEGAEFRVGKLVLNGEEPFPGAGKKILEAWHEHEGEVYDCSSPKYLFTPANVGSKLASILRGSYPETKADSQNHTVNFLFNLPDPPANARLTPSPR